MNWWTRNAAAIEAAAASVTAFAAVAALVGVTFQLAAADHISRAQTAREAFAAHLTLAVANPDLAQPPDACALLESDKAVSYVSYISHLFYAAELMLSVEDGWEPTFIEAALPHAEALCSPDIDWADSDATAALIARFRSTECSAVTSCSQ